MKNLTYSVLLGILLVGFSFAQDNGKVNGFSIKHTTNGNVIVKKGKTSGKFNLSKEVEGCVFTTREMVKNAPEDCASFGTKADFKVIDAIEKSGNYYLLIEAESPSGNYGCNACGRCGADGATTLIWVKLNLRLKLQAKKFFVISACQTNSAPTESEINKSYDGKNYIFKNDVFRIEIKGSAESKGEYSETIIWKYSRKLPEKGLVIEKRTRVTE